MIRKVSIADAEKLSELEKRNIECPWSIETLRQSILNDNYYFCVFVTGGEIVAYGGINIIIDEAEICNVAVDKNFRCSGIGGKIVNELISYAKKRDVKKIFLEVNEHNLNAINLYQKNGFKEYNKRERYYNNDSAILMKKDLTT